MFTDINKSRSIETRMLGRNDQFREWERIPSLHKTISGTEPQNADIQLKIACNL